MSVLYQPILAFVLCDIMTDNLINKSVWSYEGKNEDFYEPSSSIYIDLGRVSLQFCIRKEINEARKKKQSTAKIQFAKKKIIVQRYSFSFGRSFWLINLLVFLI